MSSHAHVGGSAGASAIAAGAANPAGAAGVVLMTLAAGQFVMALDTTVMNTAIATVAKDVGTTVTGIQTAIMLYTLVMASLMITGGRSVRCSVANGRSRSAASSTPPAR